MRFFGGPRLRLGQLSLCPFVQSPVVVRPIVQEPSFPYVPSCPGIVVTSPSSHKSSRGRLCDALITEKSGFLKVCPSSAHVMMDRGIKHCGPMLNGINCTRVRPPSVDTGIVMI